MEIYVIIIQKSIHQHTIYWCAQYISTENYHLSFYFSVLLHTQGSERVCLVYHTDDVKLMSGRRQNDFIVTVVLVPLATHMLSNDNHRT